MGNEYHKTQRLYATWEHLKGAIDRLDQSRTELEKAEREIEAAIFLAETDGEERA